MCVHERRAIVNPERAKQVLDVVESMLQSVAAQARLLWGTLLTDGGGQVTIPFVPVQGVTNRIALVWDNGTTDNFVLEANETPLELRAR